MANLIDNIEQIDFDGMPAWKITSTSGARAVVAERGATLLSWQPKTGVEIIDGYQNADELTNYIAHRSAITVPWCGRIKNGKYKFDGVSYQLALNDKGEAIHGLVVDKDFRVTNANDTLTMVYDCAGDEGYPWSFQLTVTYSLESGADGAEHLSFSVSARNTADVDIPLALGWHPYLKFPENKSISNYSLEIPARTKILADSGLIPLAGEAAYAGTKAPVVLDYIGSTKFDTSFRGLIPNAEGVVTTSLRSLSAKAILQVTQEPAEAPVMHVFSGDGLPRDPRGSLALEPLSHLPDAFNRSDSAPSLRLAPNAERSMTATLTYVE